MYPTLKNILSFREQAAKDGFSGDSRLIMKMPLDAIRTACEAAPAFGVSVMGRIEIFGVELKPE